MSVGDFTRAVFPGEQLRLTGFQVQLQQSPQCPAAPDVTCSAPEGVLIQRVENDIIKTVIEYFVGLIKRADRFELPADLIEKV